ncbi:MAG: Gfo/Idh/MocA family oxidoreductase [Armatimonadetes bacterium]|nr:Gfo/Idh/MocA family oxidoreductase [Armatimonadota bacterium]
MRKKERGDLSRRDFLRAGATAAMGVGLAGRLPAALADPASSEKQVSPNDKVVLGLIGCGGMGASNMRRLMEHPEVEVAALCDVDMNRITNDFRDVKKKYGKPPAVYRDFRKLLEDKDIDAVIVGTPDHWHALNFILACEAGKEVYCEKPISYNIVEAKAMAAAAKKYNRIVQVGTWQRSKPEFTDAVDYVRSGKLGKVVLCRAWITDGFRAGRQTPTTPPDGLDYDFWTGPAELVPYKPNHVHFNWRWFLNTGSGMTGDWGVHMIDIALLGMSKSNDLVMPEKVSCYGGRWAFPDDDRTAPDTVEAIMHFKDPDFVLHWFFGRDHPGKPGHGTEFVSADGKTLRVWRGGWTVLDASGKELPKEQAEPTNDHWSNWLDCLKSREQPRSDIASMAQTTIVCYLANAALFSGETVRWDKKRMDIVGRAGKDTRAYQREYRKPWSLPIHRV